MPDEPRYCHRCELEFEMARNPDKVWSIVLPPHDVDCPKVAAFRPKPLPPRRTPGRTIRETHCFS